MFGFFSNKFCSYLLWLSLEVVYITSIQAEHISLKRSMQTLSAASCILSQLHMFSIENNLHSYGGETFDLLICRLTENINKLTDGGWSLWCMHLELRERWKYLSKGRSSFENVSYHFVHNLLYVYGFKKYVLS